VADEAYAEGRFADALVEYRLALTAQGPTASLHAKAATAAIHVGSPPEAGMRHSLKLPARFDENSRLCPSASQASPAMYLLSKVRR